METLLGTLTLFCLILLVLIVLRIWHRPRLNLDKEKLEASPQYPGFVKKELK